MKGKKDSKSNRLDSKKLSTSQAIAQTRKKKHPNLSKSLEKLDNSTEEVTTIVNEINNLGYVDSLKSVITTKEYLFLSNYLSGGVTIDEAMIQAGYGDYNEKYRYQLSRKIIEKYETQADDSRKIARAIGAGEVFIIKTLYSLAKDSKSEKIKREASMDLAKILGLTKEQIEGVAGITLVFEGQPAQVQLVGPGTPPLPAALPATQERPVSRKPMQITK